MVNSLVAYKGKPARIVAQTTHKFDLEFADGSTRKVREKDFRFLHPEFSPVNDSCPEADFSVLAEFQEELLTLQELSEWLFDDYTAQSAWCTCALIEDGLYFYWQKDRAFVRPQTQVDSIQAKRDAEALEAQRLENCLVNVQNQRYTEEDAPYLQEVEKVAQNQSKHAKLLALLKLEQSPEVAHQFLLKLDYWSNTHNPYPARFDLSLDEDLPVEAPAIERVDLTHLRCYAIDNEGSNDADDAVSIDGDRLWVHVADVSTVVAPDAELDEYAKERLSNLYLPDQILHMLPLAVTQQCALGMDKTSGALSIGFKLVQGEMREIEICHSTIQVERMTYQQADEVMESHEDLSQLHDYVQQHQAYRQAQGAISLDLPNVNVRLVDDKVEIGPQDNTPSRDLVAELMIMAGRAAGQFAQAHEIAMPYAIQDEGEFTPELLARQNQLSLSESFGATKCFKRSAISTKPLLHYGLGLMGYLRITSPLRRYLDLLAHQQLNLYLSGQATLPEARIKELIGINNAMQPAIGKTIRSSNDHYKCLYLMQHQGWQGEGVVVDTQQNKALLMIPELGMITQLKFKSAPELDQRIALKVAKVNLVERLVDFKPV